jgi:hypothetical protein
MGIVKRGIRKLAGRQPEKILVDSDLDWGRDLKRLSQRLKAVGATSVSMGDLLNKDFVLEKGLPPVPPYRLGAPNPGWNAVGFTFWKSLRLGLQQTARGDFVAGPRRAWRPGRQVSHALVLLARAERDASAALNTSDLDHLRERTRPGRCAGGTAHAT